MALILCPECNKEVSDKALACPFCGFPISQYLAAQRRAEEDAIREKEIKAHEEAKQNEIKRKEKEYSESKSYTLLGHKISSTINDRICARIDSEYYIISKLLRHRFLELSTDSKLGLEVIGIDNFDDLWDDYLSDELRKAFEDTTIDFFDYYVDDNEEIRNELVSAIENIDDDEVYDYVESVWERASEKYTQTMKDAEMQKRSVTEWQQGNVIDEVFSKSFSGLVVATAKAAAINTISAAFSEPFINIRKEKALEKYSNAKSIATTKYLVSLFGALDGFIKSYADVHKELLIQALISSGELFKVNAYSVYEYDSLSHMSEFTREDLTTEEKKQAFSKVIAKDPGNMFLYLEGLSGILFTKDELREIHVLVDDYYLFDDIEDYIMCNKEDIPHSKQLFSWLLQNDDGQELIKYLSEVRYLRTYKDIEFSNITDKDTYIKEEKTVGTKLEKFWALDICDIDSFIRKNEELKKIRPTSDIWKQQLNMAVEAGDAICAELNNDFIKDIKCAIKDLKLTYEKLEDEDKKKGKEPQAVVYPFTVKEINSGKDSIFKSLVEKPEVISKDEIPIVRFNNGIFISSRAINYTKFKRVFFEHEPEHTDSFEISDIDEVLINQKEKDVSFTYRKGINRQITVKSHTYSIEELEVFLTFIYALKNYIEGEDYKSQIKVRRKQTDTDIYQGVKTILSNKSIDCDFDPAFSLKFRYMFKSAVNEQNHGDYEAWGYDFITYIYDSIPTDIKKAYTRKGEYILFGWRSIGECNLDILITDHAIYINSKRFKVKEIKGIAIFKTVYSDWNIDSDHKLYNLLVVEDGSAKGNTFMFNGPLKSKPIIDLIIIDRIVKMLNSPFKQFGNPYSSYEFGYCRNCGSRQVRKDRFHNNCLKCNCNISSKILFGAYNNDDSFDKVLNNIDFAIKQVFNDTNKDTYSDENTYFEIGKELGVFENKPQLLTPSSNVAENNTSPKTNRVENTDNITDSDSHSDKLLKRMLKRNYIFCSKCGSKIRPSDNFCENCGSKNYYASMVNKEEN